MPLTILRNDITKMDVDAIVNAANTQLFSGGGVCGAIFKAAGHIELNEACQKLAPVEVGHAVITPGFQLKAKHIIHAVGPIYQDGNHQEKELLESAYRNSLLLAYENDCRSIAFPLISSGIFGYPKADALAVAMGTIRTFLETHEMDVSLVVYDRKAYELSRSLLGNIQSFIQAHLIKEDSRSRTHSYNTPYREVEMRSEVEQPKKMASAADDLDHWILNQDESFSTTLLKLIDQKGRLDTEVYKRANIDRKLFSKIRSNTFYSPSKRTVIALAMALELNLKETEALLEKAGFALSHSQRFDLIVEYFITHEMYDVDQINQVLFDYDLPLLGA